jgi:hypothetical protein
MIADSYFSTTATRLRVCLLGGRVCLLADVGGERIAKHKLTLTRSQTVRRTHKAERELTTRGDVEEEREERAGQR